MDSCGVNCIKVTTLVFFVLGVIMDILSVVYAARVYAKQIPPINQDYNEESLVLFLLIFDIIWLIITSIGLMATYKNHKMTLFVVVGLGFLQFVLEFILGIHWLDVIFLVMPFVLAAIYACILNARDKEHQQV